MAEDIVIAFFDTLDEALWVLSEWFIAFPILPLVVSLALLSPLLTRRLSSKRRILVVLSGGVWLLYSIYESVIFIYGAVTGSSPIRNDMVVFAPLLVLCGILSLVSAWSRRSAI